MAILLSGCSKTDEVNTADVTIEVFPGTFVSNDTTSLPFPTSGYTVYIVGETHGNRETKQLFRSYLKSLYDEAGLRDVILEEDQAFETDANTYVHGKTDLLADGLCLRADILSQIREFNATLPEGQKVNVHLVDVDSPMPVIYQHVAELHQQLGPAAASIPLPSLSDFNTESPKQRYAWLAELQTAAEDQPAILHGLETVHLSLQWYALGNRMGTAQVTGMRTKFAPLREDTIVQNVQYVIEHLDGKPVLAFFGLVHGMKDTTNMDMPGEGFKTWAQRLVETGVPVYSMFLDGLSGEGYWREETFRYGDGVPEYKFADGLAVVSLFADYPSAKIIYADLRNQDNQNVQLPLLMSDVPASKAFDALVIFKEFTPMENECH